MSRRLLNRSGAPATQQRAPATNDLPPYQAPSCPLNEAARRALGELSNNPGTVVYHSQLKEAMRFLGGSVGDLHERLRDRRERLEAMRKRREEKGLEKTEEEERLEAHVRDMEEKVEALTDRSESAMRDLIDRRTELEDESEVLGDLYTHAATESITRQSQRNRDEAPDQTLDPDEDPEIKIPPPPSTLKIFRQAQKDKENEFNSQEPYQKYALNNDYAAFKKLWHDAMAGEDGPPLPDASRWFRANGQPVMRGVGDGGAPEEGDDDDDDIAVAREVLSINCPLTLRPMDQPYSNRKCKHTFEKAAILEYLTSRGEHQCPQTGCSIVRRTSYTLISTGIS